MFDWVKLHVIYRAAKGVYRATKGVSCWEVVNVDGGRNL